MYTRGEMALRLGLFYTAASLSGAFGGQSESSSLLDSELNHDRSTRKRTDRNWKAWKSSHLVLDFHH
jgi:hypothetical protein